MCIYADVLETAKRTEEKMRISHTTKQKKAKCLAYRNGKRCGRVARVVGSYDTSGTRRVSHHQSLCVECAERLGAQVTQENSKGFTVVSGGFGYTVRTYREV